MKRLFDMSQTTFDFSHDTDEVIDIKPPTGRTRNHRHSTRPQSKRLHNLPRHSHFFLRFSRKRNANRVADSFVKQDAEPDRRLYSPTNRRPRLSDAEVKWIINLLRQQSISLGVTEAGTS